MSKSYGLIVPNKDKQGNFIKPSIFNDDSDDNEESSKPTGLSKSIKRQDRVLQKKAVEEDPTVYQYDEIYDEMDKKRKDSKLSRKDLDRKPKYISKLMVSAERRKLENDRRIERQVQKERETEGEEFKDKESFVTTAYRKKLEEMRELEEKEKREAYLEAIGDVTKQGNLDGFYRHLYDQKVNFDDVPIKEEPATNPAEEPATNPAEEPKKSGLKERQYRKRDNDSEGSDQEPAETDPRPKLQHLPSNIDADSDFSIDSASETEEIEVKKEKTDEEKPPVGENEVPVGNPESEIVKEVAEVPEAVETPPEEPKIKIDIWKKRTVDEAHVKAVERYFERVSERKRAGFVM